MAWISNEQKFALLLLLIETQGFLKNQVFYQIVKYGLGNTALESKSEA